MIEAAELQFALANVSQQKPVHEQAAGKVDRHIFRSARELGRQVLCFGLPERALLIRPSDVF
jgi:hypothetical protein